MSKGRSNRRRGSGAMRREITGREIVPAMRPRPSMMDRPEWLPEDWTMELKRRSKSCLSSNRIDRYYICPISGKKLRSRAEVMRFLNNEVFDHPGTSSVVDDRMSLVVRTSSVGRSSSLVVAGDRPEWLPDGWSVEFRKRRFSETIDKYYTCPVSGKKLRSRLEVMRFLNNEIPDRSARSSSAVIRADIALAVVRDPPAWLPEGWKVEFRPRRVSSYVDKYYICPSSGVKLRSRREVMRFLNNETCDHVASGSAEYYINRMKGCGFHSKKDVFRYIGNKGSRRIAFSERRSHTPDMFTLKEEFLPIIEYKKSKVKRTVVRRRLFARGAMPDAKIEFANTSQKAASTSFDHSSCVDDSASEISCPPPLQIEWYPVSASHDEEFRRRPSIKLLQCPGNEQVPLVRMEGEGLAVPDANLSEGKQFELTNEQSQSSWSSIAEELRERPAIEILGEPENVSLALMRVEGRRNAIPHVNLFGEKQLEMRQQQSKLKKHCAREEFLGRPAMDILPACKNEQLSDPSMQVECKRRPEVPDANLSEKKPIEMTEKLSEFKRRIKPKKHGVGEEPQGKTSIKVTEGTGNEEPSESEMQLECKRLPEEKKPEPTKKQTEPKRCSLGEESQGQLAIKVVRDLDNETLLKPPMELECKRLTVPDANPLEEERIEMNQKLSQLKRLIQPKRCGGAEKPKGRPEIIQDHGDEKSSIPSMQSGGIRVPAPSSDRSEEKQSGLSEKLSQLKRHRQPKRQGIGEVQGQPAIEIIQEPSNEKLSEPLMQQEGGKLPVPDASPSEKKNKQHRRGGPVVLENTEAIILDSKDRPSMRKRKAYTADMHVQASKLLVDVTADSVSNVGTANRSRRVKARKIEEAQSAVTTESDAGCCLHQKDVCITDELLEKLERLKPFVEEASQEQQADQPMSVVPKAVNQLDAAITNDLREKLEKLKLFVERASHAQKARQLQPSVPGGLDADRLLLQKDVPSTQEIQEKLMKLQPFVEQASKEQPGHPLAMLPFGESWLDPCLEFAFKTLTSDFPVLEDVAAIEDYFNHQLISPQDNNKNTGSVVLACDDPCSGNGKRKESVNRAKG